MKKRQQSKKKINLKLIIIILIVIIGIIILAFALTKKPKVSQDILDLVAGKITAKELLEKRTAEGVKGELASIIGEVECGCKGDLDNNGKITLVDLDAMVNFLVSTGPPFIADVGADNCGDFDDNGQVSLLDLDAMVNILINAGPPFISGCLGGEVEIIREIDVNGDIYSVRLDITTKDLQEGEILMLVEQVSSGAKITDSNVAPRHWLGNNDTVVWVLTNNPPQFFGGFYNEYNEDLFEVSQGIPSSITYTVSGDLSGIKGKWALYLETKEGEILER